MSFLPRTPPEGMSESRAKGLIDGLIWAHQAGIHCVSVRSGRILVFPNSADEQRRGDRSLWLTLNN